MANPSVTVSTRYESMVQNPCSDQDFEEHVKQTTRLFCEFEHESHITITSIMWSRQLPSRGIETFYSHGGFHTDKDFLGGATHLTTETVITATRFLISCPCEIQEQLVHIRAYSVTAWGPGKFVARCCQAKKTF